MRRRRRVRGTSASPPLDSKGFVIVDPEDDLMVQRAIERIGGCMQGRWVVTPTPGNHGGGILCHDILSAVGHSSHPEWRRLTKEVRAATIAALRRRGVRDLVVLRAHALTMMSWRYLTELARGTPFRLWLVMHGCRPRPHDLEMLSYWGLRVWVSKPGASPLSCIPGAPDRESHYEEVPPSKWLSAIQVKNPAATLVKNTVPF